MKIAFTAKGPEWASEMDARFGRADYLLVYDTETKNLQPVDNRQLAQQGHGVGPLAAQKLFEHKADVLITGNGPGDNAAQVLAKAGTIIYTGAAQMDVAAALEAFQQNKLKKFQ